MVEDKASHPQSLGERAEELFQQQWKRIILKTDQLFARLMVCQWAAAVVIALVVSPRTWSGQTSQVNVHVWAALFLGGIISLFPVWMTRAWPGAVATRYAIAVAQMLMSALLIDLTGGRIETHFHVFGSLVILSFYRDWRVLVPATIVVYADHILRGIYVPYSVYGVLTASPWRSLEHAVWVIFEDVFLVISCLRNVREMRFIANRTAALEASHRELEISHQTHQLIMNNSLDVICTGDREGRFLTVSAASAHLWGYKAPELIGKRYLDFVHPEDRAKTEQAMIDVRIGNAISDFENRVVHKNGSLVYMLWSAYWSEADHTMFAVGRDIAARKHAEQEVLRNRDEQTRLILDTAYDAFVAIDARSKIITWNSQAEKTFGWTQKEAIGRKLCDTITPPHLREAHEQALRRFQASAESSMLDQRLELVALRRDGTEFPIELTMWPVKVDQTWTFNSFMRDISERKQAEEAIHKAREAAEAANRAKSEFLSRMSHELRTPLNAILGFSQLLQRRGPTEVQRGWIDHILTAGRHLLGLINEVLDISRIEAGRMPLSLEPVSVNEAVKEAISLMRPFAVERGIDLVISSRAGEDCYVTADLQRFKQILLNLITNAIKYAPGRGGNVAVDYDFVERERVRIGVTDNGPGITKEKLTRLFTPFERLGAEQTEVEGTGLGLALSQRLVHAMDGSIGVESTSGQGSTFWIELPRAECPLKPVLADKAALTARSSNGLDGKRKILYIEDNLSNLSLIQDILAEEADVELLTAMQGQIGLDLARQHSPDLVLLDLHLPDVPGSHVLSQLRAGNATRDIPVVMISADATPGQINRLIAAGARDYLTKPIDVDKFFQVLEQSVFKDRSKEAAPASGAAVPS
jgi:PAS domain S-box-containing protein